MRSFPLLLVAGLLFCLTPAPAWAQQIDCSPCDYNFGTVQIGESSASSIQLTNVSSQTLTILAKSVEGSGFSYGSFPLPMQLGPWASVELPVVFTPTAAGATAGVLTLTSTARVFPMNVSGTGAGGGGGGGGGATPLLTVSPATLRFGKVSVGSGVSLQAKLTASNAAVTISSDRSTSSEFAILGLNLPVTIPAGQSVPVTIQFTPNGSGKDPAKVGFISNAAGSPTIELVTGTGMVQASYSVSLSWDAGSGSPAGYNVFRGTAQSGPFQQINTALDASTTYTDSTVVSGVTYYYVTTAVNTQGQESADSSVVEAVIP